MPRRSSAAEARSSVERLLEVARSLAAATGRLTFAGVAYVYNPLEYAWPVYERYVRAFGGGPKEAVLVGMNPGPFGMTQTGVPFGEVGLVRDWMKLDGPIGAPRREHPKRPVLGFACTRSEVSGKRLWGAVARAHPDPETFFARAFVLNYCPLLFLAEGGANLTPDKLTAKDRGALEAVCDDHLRRALEILAPRQVLGVGHYAAKRIGHVLGRSVPAVPHPSPASPAANRGWDDLARKALAEAGVEGLI